MLLNNASFVFQTTDYVKLCTGKYIHMFVFFMRLSEFYSRNIDASQLN